MLALVACLVGRAVAPASAAVGSSASNANVFMPVGVWVVRNFLNVPAAPVVRYCTAVGSADVQIPAGIAAMETYLFTLTLDDPTPPLNLGQERTVQFVPGGPAVKEVTTTQGFTLAPNVGHTIFWLGQPPPGSLPTVALDGSLTVVCDPASLGIRNNNPEPLIDQ